MTKVFQILEEEKQEAVTIARKEERARVDTLMIMKGTGLTKEEIEEIKKNMMVAK